MAISWLLLTSAILALAVGVGVVWGFEAGRWFAVGAVAFEIFTFVVANYRRR